MAIHKHLQEQIKFLLQNPTNNCILWTGKTDQDGYARIWNGEFTFKGHTKKINVHRWVLEIKLGRKLNDGYLSTHLCRNRNCYNPEHLEEKLPQGNTDDRLRDKTYTRHLGLRKTNTSGYKGVTYHKASKKWRARIDLSSEKRGVSLGYFDTKEQAARAYDDAARAAWGIDCFLNFP